MEYFRSHKSRTNDAAACIEFNTIDRIKPDIPEDYYRLAPIFQADPGNDYVFIAGECVGTRT